MIDLVALNWANWNAAGRVASHYALPDCGWGMEDEGGAMSFNRLERSLLFARSAVLG